MNFLEEKGHIWRSIPGIKYGMVVGKGVEGL